MGHVLDVILKENNTRLQLLEDELLSISQCDMTIVQYFHMVKSTCREITELDPTFVIGGAQMKRIIIHGLRPEYRSSITAIYKDDPLNHYW